MKKTNGVYYDPIDDKIVLIYKRFGHIHHLLIVSRLIKEVSFDKNWTLKLPINSIPDNYILLSRKYIKDMIK